MYAYRKVVNKNLVRSIVIILNCRNFIVIKYTLYNSLYVFSHTIKHFTQVINYLGHITCHNIKYIHFS